MEDHPFKPRDPLDPEELLPILATLAALLLSAWMLPIAATLTHTRQTPRMSAGDAIVGTARLAIDGHIGDPRAAYPRPAREQMPAGRSWWLAAMLPFGVLALVGVAGWRRLEPERARARLGRRDYDPRGAEPREWARPRDLSLLVVRERTPGRLTLGRLDRRLLAADPEAHAAVIAPTRAGKTTRCVIPWLLEHRGPAVVTSTKRDVLTATADWRAQQGDVYVWDPGAADSACWTPLDGCEQWSFAVRQAIWLGEAAGEGDHHAARFWNAQAAQLLAPLLHAAALAGATVEAVLTWLQSQDFQEPGRALEGAGALPALRELSGVANLDPRNRNNVCMSALFLLAAYRHPDVLATARHGWRPESFLDGGAHTLYICSPPRRQRELAPLVVAMLSALLEAVAVRAADHGPLLPTLRILLDEAANIAPLEALPQHLSQAAAHGVRIATVWQSLAQARERYGEATDAILANSTVKLFMGPVTDQTTLSYLADLLGQERSEDDGGEFWRPKASAQALQQLGEDRALLVPGSLPPAVVRLEPFWKTCELARRAEQVTPETAPPTLKASTSTERETHGTIG